MSQTKKISIAYGDGIGPEIMRATLKILEAAKADLVYEEVEIGEKVYLDGHTSGISPETWDSLLQNRIFLKAPITTPQGGGYKSLNVTVRKTLGLFANVRPVMSYPEVVSSRHPQFDLVIVRENEEDLYAGIEHRQTQDVYQCLKLISIPGTEQIVRYAFEYAKNNKRKRVTCFVKDNIMKFTDGIFHEIFDRIAQDYPDIESDHYIVDIGAARLADRPEDFDVLVMPNLYGDILSDIAAQISGSVGLCGSANIGKSFGMFEAIHGSAPDIAGKDVANPSGLINGALVMLTHIGQGEVARKIHNAWLRTLEDGVHTADIYDSQQSKEKVGTSAFAEAVVERLGQKPKNVKESTLMASKGIEIPDYKRKSQSKKLVGVDVFLDDAQHDANHIAQGLQEASGDAFKLEVITNRGVKVWPEGREETFCTDHWRCRFKFTQAPQAIHQLLAALYNAGFDVIKTENLYCFDEKRGFSAAQGQ